MSTIKEPRTSASRIKTLIIAGLILIFLVFAMPFMLFGLWLGLGAWLDSSPEIGENIQHVDWLPNSASNVSFYKSGSFTAYEFNISEPSFCEFAKTKSWNIKEISTEPFKMVSYRIGHKLKDKYPYPELKNLSTDKDIEDYNKAYEILRPTITNGLKYEFREANGGGISVAFDRNKQRAFVQTNPR